MSKLNQIAKLKNDHILEKELLKKEKSEEISKLKSEIQSLHEQISENNLRIVSMENE